MKATVILIDFNDGRQGAEEYLPSADDSPETAPDT
tara:strand:+ start:819 stop:923 length:105 start_codon:yes stop_codon:yes gene_type:complete